MRGERRLFPIDTSAPWRARDFVTSRLRTVLAPSARHEVALLVSELATNALLHGAPPLFAEIMYTDLGCMRIAVTDHGNGLPRVAGSASRCNFLLNDRKS